MTIALLGGKDSSWLAAVSSRCARRCAVLELGAPLTGGEVLVDGERVVWQGVELDRVDAVLLERPTFSWPQPGLAADAASPRAEREARALIVSALSVVARRTRVVDPPHAALFASAPLIALERCARAGLAVQPYELVPERPDGPGWLDVLGEDLWLEPRAPETGAPGWRPLDAEGAVLSVLTIGDAVLGARRHESRAAWCADAAHDRLAAPELAPEASALALAAQRALGLSWLQCDLLDARDGPRLLRVRPGVALEPWERALEDAPSVAMAALLTATPTNPR